MSKKLEWSKYNSAVTETHTYRIEEAGRFISVIYGKKDKQQMQYNDLESVEAAKQWAQNYNDKFGADDE